MVEIARFWYLLSDLRQIIEPLCALVALSIKQG